ncbi:cobalt ECF transporter T component CbiQ [Cryptosporangium aurantiacum]|uniref:Cobalt/nickel transport system permease protein n=1 Tax=Cryptosporangium aurantiacum TaxID=134849 RepID=A0A1M7QDT7_9ACTN|nr:cobalt ECF transporter T component CbiQ [Cryptosporangium aurantiacum]SHN29050.1 cobalt/nickel transport system permease protein [Cryptosporangium aurantiacum]
MGAGHSHPLHRPGTSPVHRLPAEVKIVAALAFVVSVVATPREAVWAFGLYAVLLASVAAVARIPAGWLVTRGLIETPFVVLAVLLPFLEGGPVVHLGFLTLSEAGLWAGWNIVAKGTLGVFASLLLAATTNGRDLLLGLQRLRTPGPIVQIATFMLRYADVILGNARAMRIARLSRCHDPRFLWQVRAFATSIGSLFLRSYERGERVYVAMLSRGYTGALPMGNTDRPPARQWATALTIPAAAAAVSVTAWLTT